MELEFRVEQPKSANKQSVLELIDLYNQAADHYDSTQERDLAEIYRLKIAMLFAKPHVMQIYGE